MSSVGDFRAVEQLRQIFGDRVRPDNDIGNEVDGRAVHHPPADDSNAINERFANKLLAQGERARRSTADWYRKLQNREE